MRQRRSKRKKTERWSTRREVGDDAATGGGWTAKVDEEEVQEGGDLGGNEGEVEEGVEEGCDNGTTVNADLSKQDQASQVPQPTCYWTFMAVGDPDQTRQPQLS